MIAADLWEKCNGPTHITTLLGTLYRLVESQEQIATRLLVDTLEEQALLEEMIENNKPPYPLDSDKLHYLLKTPFRYPPLKWGSRFGRVFEPSIFYGGSNIDVTLAESAYYRFVFLQSMSIKPVKIICSEHTLFSVGYKSLRGIQLQSPPFDTHRHLITHPTNYIYTQELGSIMRNEGIEVFEYPSARTRKHTACIGIFKSTNFIHSKPKSNEQWFCDLSADTVVFKAAKSSRILKFELSEFLQDGKFPMPA